MIGMTHAMTGPIASRRSDRHGVREVDAECHVRDRQAERNGEANRRAPAGPGRGAAA